MIDHDGAILSVYDKLHLVPFGEYLPFQDFLERLGLMQLTKVTGGYIPGDGAQADFRSARARLPAADLLRDRLSGEAVPPGERPGWLVNLTNDGWFGQSSGPYQHLQQSRVRAIEEGLPLVRAANTGVSAVIDPLGRLVRTLPLGTEGVLDPPCRGRLRQRPMRGSGTARSGLRCFSRSPSLCGGGAALPRVNYAL